MDSLTILVIVLIVLILLAGVGYRSGWNERVAYGPSIVGILVAVVAILLILYLFGRI
jgi:hypothetical protein